MPAPAPIATISWRCSSDSLRQLEATLPNAAPACFGAPSRPSAAPMPTMTIDSTALPSVLSVGMRPAWNQIAAMVSMLLPDERRVSSHCPAAVTTPAARSTRI